LRLAANATGVRSPSEEHERWTELPEAIRSVMEAVKQGELDIQIEDVAEQETAELRVRAQLKPGKKVS
jgi:hypothetical protein